jgi:hypothetical protein
MLARLSGRQLERTHRTRSFVILGNFFVGQIPTRKIFAGRIFTEKIFNPDLFASRTEVRTHSPFARSQLV